MRCISEAILGYAAVTPLGSRRFAIRVVERDAHRAGPENSTMEDKPILQNLQHGPLGIIGGMDTFDRLMEVRIERLPRGNDALEALAGKDLPQLPVNQLQSLAILFVGRIV